MTEPLELQRTLYASSNPTRRWLHRCRLEWIGLALRRHAGPEASRALEFGPGSGVYLPVLLELFERVTAADVEDVFLDEARALAARDPRLEVVRTDIVAPELPPESYDLVLCTEVIEHVPRSATALARLHGLLRPGGKLVLSTPHRWSTLETVARVALKPGFIHLVRWIYDEAVFELGHVNLLTRGEVERQLAAAGFAIVERHVSGFYLPLVAEFFGGLGLRAQQALERRLRGSALEQLLWTQYYVCTKR